MYEETGELSKMTMAAFTRDKIQTGNWSPTGGIVMEEHRYGPHAVADSIVGKAYYIFPVLQYFDGEAKVIYRPEWPEQKLAPKGVEPERVQ